MKDLLERPDTEAVASGPIWGYALGTAAAFFSGWLACTWMIRLVQKSNLAGFGLYCAVVGILALILG